MKVTSAQRFSKARILASRRTQSAKSCKSCKIIVSSIIQTVSRSWLRRNLSQNIVAISRVLNTLTLPKRKESKSKSYLRADSRTGIVEIIKRFAKHSSSIPGKSVQTSPVMLDQKMQKKLKDIWKSSSRESNHLMTIQISRRSSTVQMHNTPSNVRHQSLSSRKWQLMNVQSKRWSSMLYKSPSISRRRQISYFYAWPMNTAMATGKRSSMHSKETLDVALIICSCPVQFKSSKSAWIYLWNL